MHRLFINISLVALTALSVWLVYLIIQAIADISMFEAFGPIWQASWGKVAMVDLYLGLVLISILIVTLEHGKWQGWLWAIATLALGNPIAVLYLLLNRKKLLDLIKG
ncbi:hypothetical protein [Salinibius halmophilus]|uniref:hypothetical protein n=1 Tax=Salinibius halmophilus TaxID=1853216 RepID=UPI000E670961|nr:hypothetical protein [Salinibius halmophilus]